ncbi:MAG: hypothetical protein ACI9G5_002929 [Paracoccaceae bacterium]|jgi:hypothetical protein
MDAVAYQKTLVYLRFVFNQRGDRHMTEAELWELILMSQSNAGTFMAIFLTVTSAYLVAAYAVGIQLTRYQIFIVNTIFLSVANLTMFAGYAAMSRAAFLLDFTSPEYNSPASAGIIVAPWGLVITHFMLVIACLVFMWQIRHPKSK